LSCAKLDLAEVGCEEALSAQRWRETFRVRVAAVGDAGGDHGEDRGFAAELQKRLDLVVDPVAFRTRGRAKNDEGFAVFERLLQRPVHMTAGFKIGAVPENGVELGGDAAECAAGPDQPLRRAVAIKLAVQPVSDAVVGARVAEKGPVSHGRLPLERR
jgi:hypothetical protein